MSDPSESSGEAKRAVQSRAEDDTSKMMAMAGVGPAARGRRRIRAVLLTLLFVVMAAAVGWWVRGELERKLTPKPTQQAQPAKTVPVKTPVSPEELALSPEEAARIQGLLNGTDIGKRGSKGGKLRLTARERKLIAFYRKQTGERAERAPLGPRASSVEPGQQDVALTTGETGGGEGIGRSSKQALRPEARANSSLASPLSDAQVSRVVNKHMPRVRRHLERLLRRNRIAQGKLLLGVTVLPSGNVARVRVQTPAFQGSEIEEFLRKEIKRWRFPSFAGNRGHELTFPIVLSGR